MLEMWWGSALGQWERLSAQGSHSQCWELSSWYPALQASGFAAFKGLSLIPLYPGQAGCQICTRREENTVISTFKLSFNKSTIQPLQKRSLIQLDLSKWSSSGQEVWLKGDPSEKYLCCLKSVKGGGSWQLKYNFFSVVEGGIISGISGVIFPVIQIMEINRKGEKTPLTFPFK